MPVEKGSFQSLQQNALRWSNVLKQACAVCNSLNMVSKTAVAGVDMERTLFKLVEARFLVGLFSQRSLGFGFWVFCRTGVSQACVISKLCVG